MTIQYTSRPSAAPRAGSCAIRQHGDDLQDDRAADPDDHGRDMEEQPEVVRFHRRSLRQRLVSAQAMQSRRCGGPGTRAATASPRGPSRTEPACRRTRSCGRRRAAPSCYHGESRCVLLWPGTGSDLAPHHRARTLTRHLGERQHRRHKNRLGLSCHRREPALPAPQRRLVAVEVVDEQVDAWQRRHAPRRLGEIEGLLRGRHAEQPVEPGSSGSRTRSARRAR